MSCPALGQPRYCLYFMKPAIAIAGFLLRRITVLSFLLTLFVKIMEGTMKTSVRE